MPVVKTSNCPHVTCIDGVTWEELRLKQSASQQCQVCGMKSVNLWLCLVGACQFVGCGETHKDHSADHAQEKNHCMTINLTTLRIWCTRCETEVFPGHNRNIPQLIPPLTRYFLDCSGFVRPEKSPKLAVSYMKLICELWHKKRRSYVVPSSVVSGIKVVHPMFRGYSQQDSQEFLRCFMDEIHEELKQPLMEDDSGNDSSTDNEENPPQQSSKDSSFIKHHGRQLSIDSNSSSQSEDFYETCDSGLSSDKASTELSDDSCEVTERTRLNNPDADINPTAENIQSRQMQDTDSGVSSNSGRNSVLSTKSKKEKINKISKIASTGTIQKDTLTPDNSDALSDSELVSKRKAGSVARQRSKSENIEGIQSQKILQSQNRSFKEKTARKKMVQYRSIISDIFDGKILSSVQCLTCERDLSLPIPSKDHIHMIHSSPQLGPPAKGGSCGEAHQGWISWMFSWMKSLFVGPTINLQDCLAAFFSADELKGDNMYSCEKCKKLRNGIKYSRVLELPEVQYLQIYCKSEVLLYDLVAVICHHGTAGGGHYTAYCLNAINDLWYEFDDQYVTEVDIGQVINCEAYVLFYKP
ncbi:hypothetical protein KUTeg_021791 [Tegillarca granosa]|uniref:ubiquitinyl hydrolase 1 n=1 Tax=Tegillarca granosa TaxID=220873 RepID=A0ABQ9E8R9_TEGGR|nr:hypothetical protein KUTeg_021791 [Tegillarca granosa]